jgi:polysaccharide biosynthesis protein PslG
MPKRALHALGALSTLAVAVVVLAAGAPARAAAPTVPFGFVGVNVDGPMYPTTAPGIDLSTQFAGMVRAGVESVRVAFTWAQAQPYPSWSLVPPAERADFVDEHGVPTDFSQTDEIVRLAAQRGLTVLPTVLYPPGWDVTGENAISSGRPARDGPFASFLTDLVERYGPRGTFWHGYRPEEPIDEWQIWNEPDLFNYWPTQPFAPTYVALLRAAHAAIKRADPTAKVVLAGLTNESWRGLGTIYGIKGARSLFDVVAIHPYTVQPAGVIKILSYARTVMNAHGDRRKPLIADEWGWASAIPAVPASELSFLSTTVQGQAKKIATMLPLFARDRGELGLAAFYYYTWAGAADPQKGAFAFSGLLNLDGTSLTPKPALRAFGQEALAIEGCKTKGPLASSCARSG